MCGLVLPMDNEVVSNVQCAWAPGDDLRDDVLVFLRRTADPEHHPLETIEAIVNGECCDVPGAFLQFHLVESPAEIEFGEDGAPVQGLGHLVEGGDGVALADDCGVSLSPVGFLRGRVWFPLWSNVMTFAGNRVNERDREHGRKGKDLFLLERAASRWQKRT